MSLKLKSVGSRPAEHTTRDLLLQIFSVFLIVLFAAIAYHNSFKVPFLYDDQKVIQTEANPYISGAVSFANVLFQRRALVYLSFIANLKQGGGSPVPFHVFNLSVHILAALLFFGVIRRTLLSESLRARYGGSAVWLALFTSVLWVTHPLQTESVTYICQRSESMAGLFYLLTLYCFIRGIQGRISWIWYGLSLIAYLCGQLSKEIVVTLPFMLLLYDKIFVTGSFDESLRLRRGFYIAMCAFWLILLVPPPNALNELPTAGFAYKEITSWEYFRSQPAVILQYLKVSLWPVSLCFHYGWRVARSLDLLPTLAIAALMMVTLWTFVRLPALGFAAAWFFITLAPSSSFVPIQDLAAEHRMYLPLASVIFLTVLAVYELLRRFLASKRNLRYFIFICVMTAIAGTFCFLTVKRNRDYRSDISIWLDTIQKRPRNARAHYNLGNYYFEQERFEEATNAYVDTIALQPDFSYAHNNLAVIMQRRGLDQMAEHHYQLAISSDPQNASAYENLGVILMKQGRIREAAANFSKTLQINPESKIARENMNIIIAAETQSADTTLSEQIEVR